jgi:hypothetical protein
MNMHSCQPGRFNQIFICLWCADWNAIYLVECSVRALWVFISAACKSPAIAQQTVCWRRLFVWLSKLQLGQFVDFCSEAPSTIPLPVPFIGNWLQITLAFVIFAFVCVCVFVDQTGWRFLSACTQRAVFCVDGGREWIFCYSEVEWCTVFAQKVLTKSWSGRSSGWY